MSQNPKSKELEKLKDHKKHLTEHIMDCQKKTEEADKKIKELERELEKETLREISDEDAPRAGHTWQRFEKDMCEDKLRDLTFDLAQKTGRSTLAIRYQLLKTLIKALPADTIVEKVTIMVKR